jgi:hypothetical protein
MQSKTFKGHNTDELQAGLNNCLADGFKPTLAIAFLSIKQDRDVICRMLDKKGIAIFGATTSGEFIDGELEEGSAVIMLLNLDRADFKILFEEIGVRTTREASKRIGVVALEAFEKPAFIVAAGGINTDGEMVVRGIEDVTGANATIFGGRAGDDFTMTGTYVFTNDHDSSSAVIALVINEKKVKVKGLASSGWKPVGTVRTVTKSDGNIVYTIDDEPALDLIMKYMGVSASDVIQENDVIINIGAYFPIQLQRENAPPVLRTAMLGNLADGSIVFAGNVPQGAQIRFSLPPDFDVIDRVVSECDEVKQNELHEADAAILFSCKARHVTFGPMVSDEIEGIKQVWNTPLIGYFTYGEIGKTPNGKHEFHNQTCCLVALKEEQTA